MNMDEYVNMSMDRLHTTNVGYQMSFWSGYRFQHTSGDMTLLISRFSTDSPLHPCSRHVRAASRLPLRRGETLKQLDCSRDSTLVHAAVEENGSNMQVVSTIEAETKTKYIIEE